VEEEEEETPGEREKQSWGEGGREMSCEERGDRAGDEIVNK
jgi:hypothetical protein